LNLKIEIYPMKKIFKVIGLLFVLLIVVTAICLKPLDKTPYQRTDFYQKQMEEIVKLEKQQVDSTDTLMVGWSAVNLRPSFTTPIAIDAERGGKHFEGVHDSIYARAFVFKQRSKKVAYVTADLLIIPPTVTAILDTLLRQKGYGLGNIYLTATHTHTSLGAWYPSIVGEIFAGKFDERLPKHIANCIAQSILQAEQTVEPCKIGFDTIAAPSFVENRLVHDSGTVDECLRLIKFEKQNSEKALLITYSAHATIFHEKMMSLSSDWPGELVNRLSELNPTTFVAFSAGAVGSQGPAKCAKSQSDNVDCMATGLAKLIQNRLNTIKTNSETYLNMRHIPLYLRSPNLRVTKSLVLRPWLFYWLFGNEKVYINSLKLGDIFFVGLPCDFSGELVEPLSGLAQKMGYNLVVTSFNGGYIGYITDDKWYELPAYETQTMGWFGAGNGSYFNQIIQQILKKV
jgi:hypothetical protein